MTNIFLSVFLFLAYDSMFSVILLNKSGFEYSIEKGKKNTTTNEKKTSMKITKEDYNNNYVIKTAIS